MSNQKAYYGEYGGQYVSESLMNTLAEVDAAFEEAIHDPEFLKQYHYYLKQYVGRETPLYYAERLSESYWCTQDQQCDRTDPAGKADGKDKGDRRDRGRSAWRSDSHRSSIV